MTYAVRAGRPDDPYLGNSLTTLKKSSIFHAGTELHTTHLIKVRPVCHLGQMLNPPDKPKLLIIGAMAVDSIYVPGDWRREDELRRGRRPSATRLLF
jgi:hypothetical protein